MKSIKRTIKVPEIEDLKTFRLLNHRTGEIRETPDFARLVQALAEDVALHLERHVKPYNIIYTHDPGKIVFEVVRERKENEA